MLFLQLAPGIVLLAAGIAIIIIAHQGKKTKTDVA
jgi:hypothetical protein